MPQVVEKYGNKWDCSEIEIELTCIAKGGRWVGKKGQDCGLGMFHHLMEARRLLWPKRYRHAWTDLLYEQFIENDVTVLLGCASSQKTSHASEYVLLNYLARPYNTQVLVSTVTVDKLESGVFGEIKMLWNDAKKKYDCLPGHVIDHKHCIATDDIAAGEVRDLRRGIIGKPCYESGKKWVGGGILAGVKQDWVFYVGDELQFMQSDFMKSWPNLFSNLHTKIIGSGNPDHDPDSQLGIAAEPIDGWNSLGEINKTTVWTTKFMGGKCVNLIGTDSPNFHVPEGQPEPYPKLIGRKFASRVIHDYGKDSKEFYTQVKGEMRLSLAHSRVITRQICLDHKASSDAIWAGGSTTQVMGVDPAYGGGDRCTQVVLEFGPGVGHQGEAMEIVKVVSWKVIPINAKIGRGPEDQIADVIYQDSVALGIKPENIFYDSFGKGTVGFAFARRFGANSPVPVDAGSRPTRRPVRDGLFIDDTSGRRLKRCDEHYSKFVTEMWFSVRYTIEADQMRELPQEIMLEGCSREYYDVTGGKIEVEPKDRMRERINKSPDLFDCLAISIEGCRQRGFKVGKLGAWISDPEDSETWFDKEAKEYEDAIKSQLLVHS